MCWREEILTKVVKIANPEVHNGSDVMGVCEIDIHVYMFSQGQCLSQWSLQMDQQTVVYGWAVILAAGILNLRCPGWTLMDPSSSLMDLQWHRTVLDTVSPSRATWWWPQPPTWPVEFTWHTSTTLRTHSVTSQVMWPVEFTCHTSTTLRTHNVTSQVMN